MERRGERSGLDQGRASVGWTLCWNLRRGRSRQVAVDQRRMTSQLNRDGVNWREKGDGEWPGECSVLAAEVKPLLVKP